jgi:hypothetical protein
MRFDRQRCTQWPEMHTVGPVDGWARPMRRDHQSSRPCDETRYPAGTPTREWWQGDHAAEPRRQGTVGREPDQTWPAGRLVRDAMGLLRCLRTRKLIVTRRLCGTAPGNLRAQQKQATRATPAHLPKENNAARNRQRPASHSCANNQTSRVEPPLMAKHLAVNTLHGAQLVTKTQQGQQEHRGEGGPQNMQVTCQERVQGSASPTSGPITIGSGSRYCLLADKCGVPACSRVRCTRGLRQAEEPLPAAPNWLRKTRKLQLVQWSARLPRHLPDTSCLERAPRHHGPKVLRVGNAPWPAPKAQGRGTHDWTAWQPRSSANICSELAWRF